MPKADAKELVPSKQSATKKQGTNDNNKEALLSHLKEIQNILSESKKSNQNWILIEIITYIDYRRLQNTSKVV